MATHKNKSNLGPAIRLLKWMIDYRLNQLPDNRGQDVRDLALGHPLITALVLALIGAISLITLFFLVAIL